MSDSLWSYGLYSPWNSPGQNTGVGSLSQIIMKGKGGLARGSSQPRDQTGVSCIAGGFFTSWAMSKAHSQVVSLIRIPPIHTPNTKLSWGEKGLYLTTGIPTPGASSEKMSTHSVRFWKSKEIPTGRVCIAENRDSIFNCLSHRGRPRVHS